MRYSGLHTAVVTPFTADGEVDYVSFTRLVEEQISAGVSGIVVCGSTGEGATLSSEEKTKLWQHAVECANGRATITAGTGTNDTRSTVALSKLARSVGVNGLLVVTPYYNKPTRAGLLAHFGELCSAVDLPVILYNVPGRTGANVSAETQLAIAEVNTSVVATKEASANLSQMSEIIRNAPSHFTLLAGDDDLALPAIALGATGVIAVMSNYYPRVYGMLIRAALDGDFAAARAAQRYLQPYFAANFLESNPIPVKYILHKLGAIQLTYRLPLTAPTAATQQALDAIVQTIDDGWTPEELNR